MGPSYVISRRDFVQISFRFRSNFVRANTPRPSALSSFFFCYWKRSHLAEIRFRQAEGIIARLPKKRLIFAPSARAPEFQ